MSDANAPRLSVVLPIRAAAQHAGRVLSSLCPPYQEFREPFEVLVVEAESSDVLGEERARAHGSNVRYLGVGGGAQWTARLLALGLQESRAPFVGLFTDAVHLLTPRVLDTAFRALALSETPLATLPDYRFDGADASTAGRDSDEDREWPEGFPWRKDPYSLFSVARFGPLNPSGFLGPMLGAACYFAPRASFAALRDASLDATSADALSHSLYSLLARERSTRLIVLAGEGGFGLRLAESDEPLSPDAGAVHREPLVFGFVPGPAQRFLAASAAAAADHESACRARGAPTWFEDPVRP